MVIELKKDKVSDKDSKDFWGMIKDFLGDKSPYELEKPILKKEEQIQTKNIDKHQIIRFKHAQNSSYKYVIKELKNGKKESHCIWYIFPQYQGIGRSKTSMYFSIKSSEEAKAYLKDPVLGKRLLECTKLLLDIKDKSALEIFGAIDLAKVKSSMTLFHKVDSENPIFKEVIDKYYDGKFDEVTIARMDYLEIKRASLRNSLINNK